MGTYNDENADSYLIPISLTTGQPETAGTKKITGLPENEIIYTIACNESGQMYAIVADGGDNGGPATLYTINTSSFEATRVGSTYVTTNYISSSAFAPDGTLYWAENNVGKLYTVNTGTGRATAVPGGTIGGYGYELNAMMIPDNGNTAAYVKFIVKGEDGTIAMNDTTVSGFQKVTAGEDLELTFTPGNNNKVKEVVVDGEKLEAIDSYTLSEVSAWGRGIHTVEVTFQSRDIEITANPWVTEYLGEHSLQYHPSFEAILYFTVSNGPLRHTAGVPNYQISIEKDGEPIDKSDVVPDTYDIHVTRAADADWNELDTVLKDCLTITKQTALIQWSDLELTANPGDTLADVEKPAYLVSPLDGKQIPGTFYWVDDEGTSVGELGDRTGFKFRFVPDMPLSAELAALYDFSNMPENGFDGTESNYPFTAYVTVQEAGEVPSGTDSITLPVRVLEEGNTDYSPAPAFSATFTPDTAVTVGEFNEWQGLAIDYRYPMEDTENYGPVSEGYDIQAEYTVSIPLTDYQGENLSGTLTIPLPQGYDGATARIKGGVSASSYTATTVSFPVTLKMTDGTAEVVGLLIEYREAQEPVQPQPQPQPQPSQEDDTGLPVVTSPTVPGQVSGEVGQWVTFTVAAQDGQAYQWYLDRQDGQGPQPLAGATGTSFSAQPLGADWSGYAYYCKVTNQLGSTMSPAFVLVVEGAAPAGAAPAGAASDGGSASGNGETTAAPKPSVSPEPSATPEPTAVPSPTATPEPAGGGTPTPEPDAVPASAPAEEGGGVSLVWIAVPVVMLVLFLIFLFRRTNREE